MYRWLSVAEEWRDGGSNSLQWQEQGFGKEAAAHAPDAWMLKHIKIDNLYSLIQPAAGKSCSSLAAKT